MKRRLIAVHVLFITFFVIIGGCATVDSARHNYIMRGQILEASDDGVYLCIGSKDGAEVGQEYTVHKFVKANNPNVKSVPSYYKREETGTVKITEIVDEHYAKAKVLTGDAKVHNMVELKK